MLRYAGPGDPGSDRAITIVQKWFAEFRGKAAP